MLTAVEIVDTLKPRSEVNKQKWGRVLQGHYPLIACNTLQLQVHQKIVIILIACFKLLLLSHEI